jgi:hypothetical protein
MKRWWLFQHLGLKLLSLALAIVVWTMVAGEPTVDRALRVPLEMQQFPAELQLRGEPPATVGVRVRGASGLVARLEPGDIVAVVDVGEAHEGLQQFPLTPDRVRVPFGVEVLQVTPDKVGMVFEHAAGR